jgi:hydroxyacylglutathione hydrolase
MKISTFEKPLKLMNNGELELAFIACGSLFSKEFYNNNFLIIKGNNDLLLDFGITGPRALNEITGLSPIDIENIFVTHSHSDHIGGLEYLALFKGYMSPDKNRISILLTEYYKYILWKASLNGGMEWNESNSKSERLKLNDYFNICIFKEKNSTEIRKFTYTLGNMNIEIFQTNHIPDGAETLNNAFITYGLFVDERVLFSGYTKFDKELLDEYAEKSDYFFHDTSFETNLSDTKNLIIMIYTLSLISAPLSNCLEIRKYFFLF